VTSRAPDENNLVRQTPKRKKRIFGKKKETERNRKKEIKKKKRGEQRGMIKTTRKDRSE